MRHDDSYYEQYGYHIPHTKGSFQCESCTDIVSGNDIVINNETLYKQCKKCWHKSNPRKSYSTIGGIP